MQLAEVNESSPSAAPPLSTQPPTKAAGTGQPSHPPVQLVQVNVCGLQAPQAGSDRGQDLGPRQVGLLVCGGSRVRGGRGVMPVQWVGSGVGRWVAGRGIVLQPLPG